MVAIREILLSIPRLVLFLIFASLLWYDWSLAILNCLISHLPFLEICKCHFSVINVSTIFYRKHKGIFIGCHRSELELTFLFSSYVICCFYLLVFLLVIVFSVNSAASISSAKSSLSFLFHYNLLKNSLF